MWEPSASIDLTVEPYVVTNNLGNYSNNDIRNNVRAPDIDSRPVVDLQDLNEGSNENQRVANLGFVPGMASRDGPPPPISLRLPSFDGYDVIERNVAIGRELINWGNDLLRSLERDINFSDDDDDDVMEIAVPYPTLNSVNNVVLRRLQQNPEVRVAVPGSGSNSVNNVVPRSNRQNPEVQAAVPRSSSNSVNNVVPRSNRQNPEVQAAVPRSGSNSVNNVVPRSNRQNPEGEAAQRRLKTYKNASTQICKRHSFAICPICWKELRKQSCSATSCGHLFCTRCIKRCIQMAETAEKKCPVCRKIFRGRRPYHKIYLNTGD